MTSCTGGFGERLRACRAAARLSQEELAESAGVSVRAIGDIERGRTRWPQRDSVHRLADALGLKDQQREEFFGLARRPVVSFAEPEQVTVPDRGLDASPEHQTGLLGLLRRVREGLSHAIDGARGLRRRIAWQFAAILLAVVAVLGIPGAIMGLKANRAPTPTTQRITPSAVAGRHFAVALRVGKNNCGGFNGHASVRSGSLSIRGAIWDKCNYYPANTTVYLYVNTDGFLPYQPNELLQDVGGNGGYSSVSWTIPVTHLISYMYVDTCLQWNNSWGCGPAQKLI